MADDEQRWSNEKVFCKGEGEYSHDPTPMSFERLSRGMLRSDGAFFVCTLCNGRKFVWRTGGDDLKWEWDTHPNE